MILKTRPDIGLSSVISEVRRKGAEEGEREKQSFSREKGSEEGREETIIRKSGTAMKRKETERRAGEREGKRERGGERVQ